MAPKDSVNIGSNYFNSHRINMDKERENDDDIAYTIVQRVSSMDSLEQTDVISSASDSLRFVTGFQQWISPNDEIRVENVIADRHHQTKQVDFLVRATDDDDDDEDDSMQLKTLSMSDSIMIKQERVKNEEEIDYDEYSLSHMDISVTHFDVQLQVNDGLSEPVTRYGVFSSTDLREKITRFQTNHSSQTSEMDMEHGSGHRGRTTEHSNGNNRDDGVSRRDRRANESSGSNSSGNGSNPNRNNNNSRRSNDDGSDDNDDDRRNHFRDDDDEDDEDDNESDESVARRLGLAPLDDETLRIVGRLRRLTRKQYFDQRDFETLQSLIDELIQHQHLENFSREQVRRLVRCLRLDRPLRSKSRALTFIQDRIPRRAVKYQVISSPNGSSSNVFRIWRERERRSRVDSRDSLEDEGSQCTGQQLRDVAEINHPTPPVHLSTTAATSSPNITSKVKQMAKDIDTRSVISHAEINLRTGDRYSDHVAYIPRSSSPTYPGLISVALYDVKSPNHDHGFHSEGVSVERSRAQREISSMNSLSSTTSEPSRVRQLINNLESSSPSVPKSTATARVSIKKPLHEEHSDGSTSVTSSPPVKRVARREQNLPSSTNGAGISNGQSFIFHRDQPANETLHRSHFELKRDETITRTQRTASGTTIDEYVTPLRPDAQTSVSMVRDVRSRVYDHDDVNVSRTDAETIPMKVDVETLYILERKSDKNPSPSVMNIYVPDRSPSREQHDFAMQTAKSPPQIKRDQRSIDIQVTTPVIQHTVAAQTTNSLARPTKERQRLPSSSMNDGQPNHVSKTTTTTKYEIKRRYSNRYSSEDDELEEGTAVIYIDDKSNNADYEDNFKLKREKQHSASDDHLPIVPEQRAPFGRITSRLRIDQLRDINRQVVRRHVQENQFSSKEHRSTEVYEIHTRGACKCLVVSAEEKTQYGCQTPFEQQLEPIERAYTDEDLRETELHVVVTSAQQDYQLVRRDYGLHKSQNPRGKENQPNEMKSSQRTVAIHYYNKEGQRMRSESARHLEHLPLFIRCEIEYELNHYGSARLIILAVTSDERRQMNISLKESLVDEIVARSNGRLSINSPELEQELHRQLAEPTNLLHLVDYSSREDHQPINSTDLRRVSHIDVTTSLRLIQRYRTIIHRLCQLYRSHLRLTHQAEQQRHLILVARDEYYLLDLTTPVPTTPSSNVTNIGQRQHDIFTREVSNVLQQPFDYAKYRRETEEQQQRLREQRFRQREENQGAPTLPPPTGHPSEAEFYFGSQRRALIEREIHSMRGSIRDHEHAPPRYKHEPARRSLSVSYSGGQRYIRARIIHVKDFYDDAQQREKRQAKEQELFVRVDDYINESAANSLRRSYSTDYLKEDGPRSRIRHIRIPGETIRIEEKTTYEYQGVMYANLPYSLRYWNILYILDREARRGRPLGSTLPQVIVDDPYRTVIPPLTQQEIRQTAQQILSPQYSARSYTDQTLRWFLSRDNRTEIESAKYLQTLDDYRVQQQQEGRQQSHVSVRSDSNEQPNKYFVTETMVRYEKMPDRLVPVPTADRRQSKENLHQRSPSIPQILHPPTLSQTSAQRSQSQPRPQYMSSTSLHRPAFQTPQQRTPPGSLHLPLSRHQSVNELRATGALSHPPSPSPSLHSLHSHHQSHQHRRPVAFHNRFAAPKQNPLFTEIIDSQTGRRILTTSQEQLPSEVLGLLNKYNLQQM